MGFHLAAHAYNIDGFWSKCEMASEEGLSFFDEKTPLSIQTLFYEHYLSSLNEQKKYSETIQFIRGLINENHPNGEYWGADLHLLSYFSEALVKSSAKQSQVQNAIHTLTKKVQAIDYNSIQDIHRTYYYSIVQDLEQLHKLNDDDKSANELAYSQWKRFWDEESKTNDIWECYETPNLIANYTAEKNINYMTLPEPLSGSQKQYHSNPTIVSKGSVAKSKKFDMAIQPQELFAYKIRNAKVQYAHGDRETILTSTGCDLHLFADQISARPPVGFPLT